MAEAKVNIYQMSKAPAFLKAFRARPGHKIVSLDFCSIEDVVLTELTMDPNLVRLYGPGQPPNCGYLFLASQLPFVRDEVLKWYDPDATTRTEEELAVAKKMLKPIRSMTKPAKLAMNYGAYPKRVQAQCTAWGHPISFEQAQAIFDTYHGMFPGIREASERLQAEVRNNGGYFLNGRGRPIAVAPDKMRDVVNTDCQSTAGDLLLTFVRILVRLKLEYKLDWHPWLINFYDECDIECPDEKAEETRLMMNHCLHLLNEEIQPNIPIKGEAVICDTMADWKCD